MANTLKFGNGEWYGKKDTILAYNDENSNYKPLPFDFSRASKATVINKDGLIEEVGIGQPRVDYKDNSSGALLLEPSSTNNLLQSNQFDTTWSNLALTPISNQIGVGGSDDAWLLNVTGNSGSVRQNVSQSGVQTLSVYAKQGVSNWIALYATSAIDPPYVYFDLENGIVGTSFGDNTINENIESVGNGWYRCSITFDKTITSNTIRIFPAKSDNVLATSGDSIYIQNAQLEQGSYPTSYIPTEGSVVTRLADSCSNGGNEQVINSTEGVFYFEGSALANDGTNRFLSLNDGTVNNYIYFRYVSTLNQYLFRTQVGGITVNTLSAYLSDTTENHKFAFKFKSGDYAMWVDGVEISTDTSATIFASNTLSKIEYSFPTDGGDGFPSNTKDIRVYNTALTDQELAALTQV